MSAKNTLLPVQTLLQSRGKLLDISKPAVMGILNATPDSFYNKGRERTADDLLRNAEKMLNEGAAILDIGGASTRPGSELIRVEDELERVLPVIKLIHQRFPEAWLSADTYNAATAEAAVAEGVSIINDISGGRFDENMLSTVARLQVPYVAMHIQGTPETMQQQPRYEDVVYEVRNALRLISERCDEAGIKDVIIDPGFGFGKTVAHNFQLLNGLHLLRMLGRPVLAGISRKSMICKTLEVTPDEALNGTTALHMIALQQGASILRVHDVKEVVQVVKLYEALHA
ncbi:MAG TPA: dihydropteroate synthase [Flavipsychrobacter sp.]|nr:dihydropteroate synthase [Flavipsychrobacter sp.]